jgi:hypothetical protein
MALQTVKVQFTYDNGYGSAWNIEADVTLDYEAGKVANVDWECSDEPKSAYWKAIEERAVEAAFDEYERKNKLKIINH